MNVKVYLLKKKIIKTRSSKIIEIVKEKDIRNHHIWSLENSHGTEIFLKKHNCVGI